MMAECYQIPQLKQVAEAFLSAQLKPSNALQMNELAKTARVPALKRACLLHALRHLSKVPLQHLDPL
jgi:hypothetical protein